jgi:hypothetical protein
MRNIRPKEETNLFAGNWLHTARQMEKQSTHLSP